MRLNVDPQSATPIYAQLCRQIRWAISAGMLADGDTLPSVRQLAQDLRVNPNTVVKAYSELDADGIITSVHGKGTFVAYGAQERLPAGSHQVTQALRDALSMARDAGMSAEHVRQLLEEQLRLIFKDEFRGIGG